MWVKFSSDHPFAIKVYLGGVNAVTGESVVETSRVIEHQTNRLAIGRPVQDYLVTPDQQWLDGVATADGKVMQFVATPVGTSYSVEAQVTGKDRIAGMQFEIITPQRICQDHPHIAPRFTRPTSTINVTTLTGKLLTVLVAPSYTIEQVKDSIKCKEGIPVQQQRLVCHEQELEDGEAKKIIPCNHVSYRA
jgi:hypothetical protein